MARKGCPRTHRKKTGLGLLSQSKRACTHGEIQVKAESKTDIKQLGKTPYGHENKIIPQKINEANAFSKTTIRRDLSQKKRRRTWKRDLGSEKQHAFHWEFMGPYGLRAKKPQEGKEQRRLFGKRKSQKGKEEGEDPNSSKSFGDSVIKRVRRVQRTAGPLQCKNLNWNG